MGRSYKDLVAWQKSMDLVTAIYKATRTFQKMSCLESQPSFAARPFPFPATSRKDRGRLSEKEFRFFLGQARGSRMEVETELQIAENLSYLDSEDTRKVLELCVEVGRILNGLISSVAKQAEA